MAVPTFTRPLACRQAPWAVTPEGQQTDFLQEVTSTLIRSLSSSLPDAMGLMTVCVLYTWTVSPTPDL